MRPNEDNEQQHENLHDQDDRKMVERHHSHSKNKQKKVDHVNEIEI